VSGPLELRHVLRDGEWIWQLRCPRCGKWGLIDDDQLRGRVSILHEECGFHETHDLSSDPLVQSVDDFDYFNDARGAR
jgi:hypothetical protein